MVCIQFSQSCPTLCDHMDSSTPVFPVHHQLPEPTQTHAITSVMLCIIYHNKETFLNGGGGDRRQESPVFEGTIFQIRYINGHKVHFKMFNIIGPQGKANQRCLDIPVHTQLDDYIKKKKIDNDQSCKNMKKLHPCALPVGFLNRQSLW